MNEQLDVKAAKVCWKCFLGFDSDPVDAECPLIPDNPLGFTHSFRGDCHDCESNAARVGLALAGAWEEVETQFIRNAEDGVRATALCIAVRHGLPVEGE
ncbi:MAG: hypothetical protein WC455_27640 [Dehalococcoidia bacterium]|jgi:hypothetical protein